MKRTDFVFLAAAVLAALLYACAKQEVGHSEGEYQPPVNKEVSIPPAGTAKTETVDPARAERLAVLLEEIAEIERSGLFRKWMGAAESAIREKAGDYPGAVATPYKEMLWAYRRAGAASL